MIVALVVAVVAVIWALFHPRKTVKMASKLFGRYKPVVPVSVDYHFTSRYSPRCVFCAHKAPTVSHMESLENILRGLRMLKEAGMKRINFAGGEPLIHSEMLVDVIAYCKEELGLTYVSVVTNGALLTGRFIYRTAPYLDSLTISCDIFNHENDNASDRLCCGSGGHPRRMYQASRLCRLFGIKFKINTLVNRYNVDQDMNAAIQALDPFRWVCSPMLVSKREAKAKSEVDENDSKTARITSEEFRQFHARHRLTRFFIPRSRNSMAKKSSYLLLDEYARFLNKETGKKTRSILEVGAERALDDLY